MPKFDPWPVFKRQWNQQWSFLVGFPIIGITNHEEDAEDFPFVQRLKRKMQEFTLR